MALLITAFVLLVIAIGGGLLLDNRRQERATERNRDQARLRVIEGQLAGLQAALRIQVAEHSARRRMQEVIRSDVGTQCDVEEPWIS